MDGTNVEKAIASTKKTKKKRRHSRKLKVLVITLLVVVGIYGALVIHDHFTNQMHPLYDAALQKAQESDLVKSHLGNDIEGALPDRSIVNDTIAEFEFYIEGPLGIAAVQTKGKKVDGDWVPTTVNVDFFDGYQHSLLR